MIKVDDVIHILDKFIDREDHFYLGAFDRHDDEDRRFHDARLKILNEVKKTIVQKNK